MIIEKVKLDNIKPYESNAKEHPEEQIKQIKKSIIDFGNNDPIAIDENGVIIEGHGRYIALKELGYKEVECIVLKGLSEEQKNAYRLVHNKLTMNSDFDFEKLELELFNLSNDFNMASFGFEEIIKDCEEFSTDFELPDEETPQTRTITLSLCEEQYDICMSVIDYFKDKIEHSFGNNNKKSNALFEAVYQWAEQNSLS